MTTNVKVRFSKNGNSRKNTLLTVREGDTIYFGIARCNVKSGERFDRNQGLSKAARRVTVAKSGATSLQDIGDDLRVHRSGLFGNVKVDNVLSLLVYFDNIDALSRTGKIK